MIETIPEKLTICSTIYTDRDDCDTDGELWSDPDTTRIYPTWAFADQKGKANFSLKVMGNPFDGIREDLFFTMGTSDYYLILGMLRLSIFIPILYNMLLSTR